MCQLISLGTQSCVEMEHSNWSPLNNRGRVAAASYQHL